MPGPAVDHSARDFEQVRAALLAEVRRRIGWEPDSAADVGLTVVEVLAHAADQLAYAQDAVATEAYIGTARQARSIRRHARLVGVAPDIGCSARTWVRVDVDDGSTVDVPAGSVLLTRMPGASPSVLPDVADRLVAEHRPETFETATDLTATSRHQRMPLHHDGGAITLPAGATSAVLCGEFGDLVPGMVLEISGGSGVPPQLVRLVEEPERHVRDDHPVTVITWHPNDRLRHAVGGTGSRRDGRCASTAVVNGNLVIADHGGTREPSALVGAPGLGAPARFRGADLSCAAPLPAMGDLSRGATQLLHQEPDAVRPIVRLVEEGVTAPWVAVADLLAEHRFARAFVVEPDDPGWYAVRFAGAAGARPIPIPGDLSVVARIGVGPAGNVARGAIAHLVSSDRGVAGVTNVVPAVGGRLPEPTASLVIRAPRDWQGLASCVVPDDYAAAARVVDGVVDVACEIGASPAPGVVAVDVVIQAVEATPALLRDVRAALEPRRVVGHDVRARGPRTVEPLIALSVLIAHGTDPDEVERQIRDRLGDGPGGLFDRSSARLGVSLTSARVLAAVAEIAGVLDPRIVEWPGDAAGEGTSPPDLDVDPTELVVPRFEVRLVTERAS